MLEKADRQLAATWIAQADMILSEWRLCLIEHCGFNPSSCLHFPWKTQGNFKSYIEFWGLTTATENWCLILTVKIAVKIMIGIQPVLPKAQHWQMAFPLYPKFHSEYQLEEIKP